MSTRRKTPKVTKKPVSATLADFKPAVFQRVAVPPARVHAPGYHWPLLLDDDGHGACEELLKWFEGIEEVREMPWRKRWVDPEGFEGDERSLGEVLAKRAYEVWVSEISEWIAFLLHPMGLMRAFRICPFPNSLQSSVTCFVLPSSLTNIYYSAPTNTSLNSNTVF